MRTTERSMKRCFVRHGDDAAVRVRTALSDQRSVHIIFERGIYRWRSEHCIDRYYDFSNNDGSVKRIAMLLDGHRRVTIDGGGATFMFSGLINPIIVDHARDVRLKNMIIDWRTPLHAVARITASSRQGIDLKFEDALPYRIVRGMLHFTVDGWESGFVSSLTEIDVKARRIADGSSELYLDDACVFKALSSGMVRLSGTGRLPRAGNVLVLRFAPRYAAAVSMLHSADIVMENVEIRHAPGMGVIAQYCRNIDIKKLTVRPGRGRYISVNEDAVHAVHCSGRVTISDCRFENMLDDAVNIHGIYARICAVHGPSIEAALMHHQQYGAYHASPGDVVEIVRAQSLDSLCRMRIAACTALNRRCFIMRFDRPLPHGIRAGDMIDNRTRTPSVIIRNCTVRGNRPRGFLVTAKRAVIEGNRIASARAGVQIDGDAASWYESGRAEHVVIRDNIFERCNHAKSDQGVIDIMPQRSSSERPYHGRIVITGNYFDLASPRVVRMNGARDAVIRGNTIRSKVVQQADIEIDARCKADITSNNTDDMLLSIKKRRPS